MIAWLHRILHDERGAIALIFAISLLPMAMLIALAIDFSFYTQARAQITLAADAAATYAVRAATETYTAETNANPPDSNAVQDAIAAGQKAGTSWFTAQLGTLPAQATVSNLGVIVVSNASSTTPAGFTATVSYTGGYPPFFHALFTSNTNASWTIQGASDAAAAYNYVEILMLLDNSSSMMIGATPGDITAMEQNTSCPASSWTDTFGNGMYQYTESDNPSLFINMANETNYNVKTSACNPGYTPPGAPFSPCAFACHTSRANQDYYGIARKLGVTLRLDVVLSAAENVISSMEANEQAPGQFSVGVYQFNTDISPLYPNSPSNITNIDEEASTGLSGALSAVEAIDYNKNPSETAEPPLVPSATPDTNFPLSVTDLLSGTYANGSRFGPKITAAQTGATPSTPQKDIFIVTDGMEDAQPGSTRYEGEMTSVAAEDDTITPNPGVCKQFKSLGFTVYVLYVDYYPAANAWYETDKVTPTPYFTEDFPRVNPNSLVTQSFAEATSVTNNGQPPGPNAVSPDEAALQACASSSSDFFIANNAADISTAMNAMLKSALSSAIRVTH
ncbi:MAG: pilus assembly protein TadG-related protein [Acidiphilium sp.]|nr:pilus assembly protein TadG-related protein [Acidiphilium sp.]MDD4935280.1 pilus assembly protein TadG-related protein [Acidiphilium sp.]